LKHPDTHQAASNWSEDQVLHVVGCYSNPFRWRQRREIANDFRRHMERSPNVRLHVVELAYGDRPFEVTSVGNPDDLQLRTSHELFHKENLQNLCVARLPPGWKNAACVDMDFHFTRHDWALEAIHQLQHHEWVQLFSSYVNLSGETLGSGHRQIGGADGFAYSYVKNGYRPPKSLDYRGCGAPGGAWAFRRESFDAVGGLLDRCILGSGDWYMAWALVGGSGLEMHKDRGYSPDYVEYVRAWEERAKACRQNVGYVDGFAVHHFHGPMKKRGYSTRNEILIREKYSPVRDVHPDWQGVLQLAPRRHRLRDEVRRYFLSRSEDLPHGCG
jgi:hypothetical protein